VTKHPKNHMAQDQYGNTFHNLGPYPRKALLKELYAKGATKMWRDTADGGAIHVGYVIKGHWLSVSEVIPWRKK